MIQLENYNADTNYNLLEDDDIVNSLTSTATNKALSANQGKIIFDNIVENDKLVKLWEGSAGEWTNTVTLNDNFRNYSDLFFMTSTNKFVCHIKIPKNVNEINPCVLCGLSWNQSNIPVVIYFTYGTQSTTQNTLTFVSQSFKWSSSNSNKETVVEIYGIKRMFNE